MCARSCAVSGAAQLADKFPLMNFVIHAHQALVLRDLLQIWTGDVYDL